MSNVNDFKWQPWQDFAKDPEVLPIDGPPCVHCEHWCPVRIYSMAGDTPIYDGVQLCHHHEQERDFSCFVPKST